MDVKGGYQIITDMKNMYSFVAWCWRRGLETLWIARKTNKWVPDQIKPEFPLNAKSEDPEGVVVQAYHEKTR